MVEYTLARRVKKVFIHPWYAQPLEDGRLELDNNHLIENKIRPLPLAGIIISSQGFMIAHDVNAPGRLCRQRRQSLRVAQVNSGEDTNDEIVGTPYPRPRLGLKAVNLSKPPVKTKGSSSDQTCVLLKEADRYNMQQLILKKEGSRYRLLRFFCRLPISVNIVQTLIEIRQARCMKLPYSIIPASALHPDLDTRF